jgi:hypothetical protein
MAQQWLALIASLPNDYRNAYIKAYPIATPNPSKPGEVDVCVSEAWDTFQAFAGRAMDGGAFYEYLVADASTTRGTASSGLITAIIWACRSRHQFLGWAQRWIAQLRTQTTRGFPNASSISSPRPRRCRTARKSVSADEYSGRLDGIPR